MSSENERTCNCGHKQSSHEVYQGACFVPDCGCGQFTLPPEDCYYCESCTNPIKVSEAHAVMYDCDLQSIKHYHFGCDSSPSPPDDTKLSARMEESMPRPKTAKKETVYEIGDIVRLLKDGDNFCKGTLCEVSYMWGESLIRIEAESFIARYSWCVKPKAIQFVARPSLKPAAGKGCAK